MDQFDEALGLVAAEAFAALNHTRQIIPFSSRKKDGLSVDDAYRVTPLVRQLYEAGGAKVVGRKIGFTNRTIGAEYGVYAPIWGYVLDRSVHDLASVTHLRLAPFSEPRIEPEIIFGLAAAPSAQMDDTVLASCIAWMALGFEIVQSIYPAWKFSPADTIVANGLHGALLIGPRNPFTPRAAEWQRTLSAFEIDLYCDGRYIDRGHAKNVLDCPLQALRHLVTLLTADPFNPPLAAGEVVSTGRLTKAMPILPGENWTASPSGIALDRIALRFS